MNWRPDERPEVVRIFGCAVVTPERQGVDTAHRVTFRDGREVRVLPDGLHSGQKRSTVLRGALERCDGLIAGSGDLIDPLVWLRGVLSTERMVWEELSPLTELADVSIDEWLEAWFDDTDRYTAQHLIADLESDGWLIVRREETA